MIDEKSRPTTDDVIDGLREHVWQLLVRDKVDAAMVLLEASLPAFMAALERDRRQVEVWEAPVEVPRPARRRRPIPMPAPASEPLTGNVMVRSLFGEHRLELEMTER